jgi:hypothetical protein
MSKSPKIKIQFLAVIFITSVFCLPAYTNENVESLFNGTDLSGWVPVGTPKAFNVKNKSIYTTGASPYLSWLRTEKEYENFILRFDYKTKGWYEGGLLIHAPEFGFPSKMGLKFHIRHDRKKYGKRSPGALYDAAAPRSIVNKPSGQWNQCEIQCDWPKLQITLNGTIIHDIDMQKNEAFRYRLRKGYIGIQNIGCKAYFRNIEIQPLPSKEDWTFLFKNGLQDFQTVKDTIWQIENNTLTGKTYDGFIRTKQEYEGPFELQVWVKQMMNGNGGVHFNWGSNRSGIEVQCFNSHDATNPTGSFYNIEPASRVVSSDEEWYLLQIFSDGPNAMVLVNGEKVSETNRIPAPHKGYIGFQQHTHGAIIHYREAKIIKRDWYVD